MATATEKTIQPGATFKSRTGNVTARVVDIPKGKVVYQIRNGVIGRFQAATERKTKDAFVQAFRTD